MHLNRWLSVCALPVLLLVACKRESVPVAQPVSAGAVTTPVDAGAKTSAPSAALDDGGALVPPAPARIHLARIGTFHHDEIEAQSGDEMFALFPTEAGWQLDRHRVQVRRVNDPVLDEEGEATGKAVSLATDPEGVMEAEAPLLLGGPLFREDALRAAEYDPACLASGVCDLVLGERRYTVRVTQRPVEVEGEQRVSMTLHVSDGAARSTLSEVASIYFAGDLDGDSRLDLVVADGPFHYNIIDTFVLYLSSQAPAGAVLGKAAAFRSVGG